MIFILIFSLVTLVFWTQELYSEIRSSIRREKGLLPSWTCRGSEMTVQILARCANPSFTHTNLAFTSILTCTTPAYKAEIITFVHKIKLNFLFEKLWCREREREREKEWKRSFHCKLPYLLCACNVSIKSNYVFIRKLNDANLWRERERERERENVSYYTQYPFVRYIYIYVYIISN